MKREDVDFSGRPSTFPVLYDLIGRSLVKPSGYPSLRATNENRLGLAGLATHFQYGRDLTLCKKASANPISTWETLSSLLLNPVREQSNNIFAAKKKAFVANFSSTFTVVINCVQVKCVFDWLLNPGRHNLTTALPASS